ncbi:glycosyltransferase [Selenomonas ruminis]|uniref:Glycosyltransferase family 1 protein n=1 Tax=Selenomonas ruminis TaxID=2593411 RepID=A0A5D6WDC4_9FIRM|nr:glycosyltransferase [Selenomonas sp. mPRGC5]TYZ24848.1 glycosyltransferase family 1 protein [Selenomonas sp. mPRGC5]
MAEELHVLHVVGAMNIGGIENMLMTLMPYMRKKGIIFDFAVHGETIGIHEPKIKELGGKIYHLPKFVGVNIFTYLLAWRNLFVCHPELKIIHGHMTSTASIYLCLAKKYGRITIAHSHSTSTSGGRIVYGVKRLLEYPLRYISDYLCACSAAAADYRFGKGTHNRSNYFLWHNAIDTEKFKFSAEKRKEYRKKLGIAEHTVVIGHVGRMVSAKNHKFLLEIFAAYRQINMDSKLLLLGNGPMRKDIKKKSEEMGLMDEVIFIGAVKNPADYLSAIDVFCYPSLYEGLSVAMIEAQINGKICLGSDVIPREVVISNKIKFLQLTLSANEWAKKIETLRKDNDTIKMINNPYIVKNVTEEINEKYRSICG